jgi:polyribonucleotide nucleotidyltransferase
VALAVVVCTALAAIILKGGGDEVDRRDFVKIAFPTIMIAVVGYLVTFLVMVPILMALGLSGKAAALLSALTAALTGFLLVRYREIFFAMLSLAMSMILYGVLVKEGEQVRVLTDILGDEDHLGDMDFKVAGTSSGITAIQMDNKVGGVTREVMRQALHQARDARLFVLSVMEKALESPRTEVSMYAPRIVTIHVKPDKIREIIGPGGKNIRALVEETGCKIDIEDDGTVVIASADGTAIDKAIASIQAITAEPEVGRIYKGRVRKVVEFGAFVEIMPGTDGLLHISQLSNERVRAVEDVVHEGDEIYVKVLEVGRDGKIRLSLREALEEMAKKKA